MVTVKEAQFLIGQQARSFGMEIISIQEAQGRTLAENIFSDRDYPPFYRAAMDGYAFRAEDFLQKGFRQYHIKEEIYAGAVVTKKLDEGECYKIMTGAATPMDADTIVKIEDTEQKEKVVFFTIDKIEKGQNIARKGEDKKEGDLVFKNNTLLGTIEIAALAVLGKSTVQVYKLPKIVVISTGNELTPIGEKVLSHQIRESNSYSLEGFLRKYNIHIAEKIIVADDKNKLTAIISQYINADILVLSGGVSMGDADFVPEVLNAIGVKKIFHKVAIKPGKPLWFGKSNQGVVFALPGNPMSVQVAYKVFLEPFLRTCFGLPETLSLKLPIASDRIKKVKFDEYFPCMIEGEELSALKPVLINGSGDVTSSLYSHGLALHEENKKELKKGDIVQFYFW